MPSHRNRKPHKTSKKKAVVAPTVQPTSMRGALSSTDPRVLDAAFRAFARMPRSKSRVLH